MEKQGYENENIERKYLENTQNHQFSKQKGNLLELEIFFLWNWEIWNWKIEKKKLKERDRETI